MKACIDHACKKIKFYSTRFGKQIVSLIKKISLRQFFSSSHKNHCVRSQIRFCSFQFFLSIEYSREQKLNKVQSIFLSCSTQNRTHKEKAATYCETNGIEKRNKKKFLEVETFKVAYKLKQSIRLRHVATPSATLDDRKVFYFHIDSCR